LLNPQGEAWKLFLKILSSPCPRRESSFVVSLNGLLRQSQQLNKTTTDQHK